MITVTLRPGQHRNQNANDQPDYMLINWRVSGHTHIWRPPTDLLELEDRYMVRVEISGMDESDFDISLDQFQLTIRGSRPDISERRAYHQMEINFGEFVSSVTIPGPIEHEKVTADYHKGFLIVYLPKAFPKQIYVTE